MHKIFRLTALLLAVGALVLTVTPSFAQSSTKGSIRLFNASPDAPAMDIYFNQIKAISNLGFKAISEYKDIPNGTYNVKAFAAPSNGTGTPLFEVPSFVVNNGSISTIVAVGLVGNKSLTALPLSDENTVTTADRGKAKVRFIHGSPDAPAVNVTAVGIGDVFNNISFKSVGNYVVAPAGPLALTVKATAEPSKAVLNQTFNLEAGKVYSIFVVGQLAGSPSLSTVLATDTAVISTLPGTGQGDGAFAPAGGTTWWLVGALVILAVGSLYFQRRTVPVKNR